VVGIIAAIIGAVITIVGFMYKLMRDTRREIGELRSRDVEPLKVGLAGVQRDVEALRRGIDELRVGLGRVVDIVYTLNAQLAYIAGLMGLDRSKLGGGALGSNPLTEAEQKRLQELLGKSELTLEEADELVRLAKKYAVEHLDREAMNLVFVAALKRFETYRRHGKSIEEIILTSP
jgi:hypothetical protein